MKKNTNRKASKKRVIDLTNEIKGKELTRTFRQTLRPRTENQKEYIRSIVENDIVICQGLAGTGKTHIAIGLALEYLMADKVKKIIITRPCVESGEKMGYLPGSAEEKLHPYLLPILDEIMHFISKDLYNSFKLHEKIEIVPLAHMRGRNFHHSFIVADECQNAKYKQLKMLLTRLGMGSKMILTGDVGQSDLDWRDAGGFSTVLNELRTIDRLDIVQLHASDIVRNPIIASILSRLDTYEQTSKG